MGGDGSWHEGGLGDAASSEDASKSGLMFPKIQLVEGQLPPVVHVVL